VVEVSQRGIYGQELRSLNTSSIVDVRPRPDLHVKKYLLWSGVAISVKKSSLQGSRTCNAPAVKRCGIAVEIAKR
jgi:hypothetical protein